MVQGIGGTLYVPQMDGDRIRAYFGRCTKVESAEVPEKIAREGAPAKVWPRVNSESELKYGHHRSAAKYREEVLRKAATDVAQGKTIVFPVTQAQEIRELRILPVGVIVEKEKLRSPGDRPGGKANGRVRSVYGAGR